MGHETVSDRIKRFREERGMSPTELAAAVRLPSSTIVYYEAGVNREPSFSRGVAIAKSLGVDPETLAFGGPYVPAVNAVAAHSVDVTGLAKQLQDLTREAKRMRKRLSSLEARDRSDQERPRRAGPPK